MIISECDRENFWIMAWYSEKICNFSEKIFKVPNIAAPTYINAIALGRPADNTDILHEKYEIVRLKGLIPPIDNLKKINVQIARAKSARAKAWMTISYWRSG